MPLQKCGGSWSISTYGCARSRSLDGPRSKLAGIERRGGSHGILVLCVSAIEIWFRPAEDEQAPNDPSDPRLNICTGFGGWELAADAGRIGRGSG
jgi:hypothetical protein